MSDYIRDELDYAFIDKEQSDENLKFYDFLYKLTRRIKAENLTPVQEEFMFYTLTRLLHDKPLTPLTGGMEEWQLVRNDHGRRVYQNKRCESVYLQINEDDHFVRAIDTEGNRYELEWDNSLFTQPSQISFPYCPPSVIKIVYK